MESRLFYGLCGHMPKRKSSRYDDTLVVSLSFAWGKILVELNFRDKSTTVRTEYIKSFQDSNTFLLRLFPIFNFCGTLNAK
jgi:hypothetical protein